MDIKPLSRKPLVEAVFELRWELKEVQPGIRLDPNYKIMVGRLYERIEEKYPKRQLLPAATMPDEIAGYIVQHQFKDNSGYPLVQVGPGVLTLNDTEKYSWRDFRERIQHLLNEFFKVYPSEDLNVNGLLLRYIDAINFNYETEDVFLFLERALKTAVNVPQSLFDGTQVGQVPLALDLRFSYPSSNPRGAMHLRFLRAETRTKRGTTDLLSWETMVQSIEEDAPKTRSEIVDWLENAHRLADDWFFKLIEGELQEKFE